MPDFNYTTRSSDGHIEQGILEANDRRHALQVLNRRGLQPVSLEVIIPKVNNHWSRLKDKMLWLKNNKQNSSGDSNLGKRGGQSREKVGLQLLKRLMELHSSGLPIGDSIKILSKRLLQTEQKALAQAMWRELSEGSTLAGALTRQPKYFSSSISYVLEAGEATGNLTPILKKVIDYLEEKQANRSFSKQLVHIYLHQNNLCHAIKLE